MNTIKYHEWRAGMEQENPLVECPDCDGIGLTPDECECCGSELDSEECGLCDGDGRVRYSQVNQFQRSRYFTQRHYLDAVLVDLEAWAAWTGKAAALVALEAGFVLASRIHGRQPYLVGWASEQERRAA